MRYIYRVKRRDKMIDITAQVQKLLAQENVQEGLVVVYSSHTTAGIKINENADPDVQKDILRRLGELYPWNKAEIGIWRGFLRLI